MHRFTAFASVLLALLQTDGAVADQSKSHERAKAFATLPDWRGIWQNVAWLADASGRPPGGEAEIRAKSKMVADPPYNAEWGARYRQAQQDLALQSAKMAGLKGCTRVYPGVMEGPYTFQLATLPEETLFIFNNGQVRHIYTDGRGHPPADDLWSTALGDSVGHWERDTLVIETIARDATKPIMPRAFATYFSDRARFTERVRRLDADTLEDAMSVEDPVSLERPWTFTLLYRRLKSADRLVAYDCEENDRNPLKDDGTIGVAPAQ